MADHEVPFYRFAFRGGLSISGIVERVASTMGDTGAHRIRYRLDDQPIAAGVGRVMPAVVADLIDVGSAVYIADRLALRDPVADVRSPNNRWHRRIHVVLPLRHPDRWRQSAVIVCLEEVLASLTDDVWSFDFVDRSSTPRPAEAQIPYLRDADRDVAVALHSGGLDSLCGLAHLIQNGHEETIAPVTVITNARVRNAAAAIIDETQKSDLDLPRLLPLQLRIGVSGIGRSRDDREPSQRARAMLFLVSGIGAASILGAGRLYVCENGIGAINLPMTADHWGARATRAMHPKTLLLLGRLATLVLDRTICIENVGLFATKGELVRELIGGPITAAAQRTVSCDRVSYLGVNEACGACASCILRRVALVAAALDHVVDAAAMDYRVDWFDPATTWGRQNAIHLMAMRDQVERLRAATGDDSGFASLDRAFPELFDIVALAPALGLTEDEVERRLLRLYRTYVREFDAFVAKIDRAGWGWSAKVAKLQPGTPADAAAAG